MALDGGFIYRLTKELNCAEGAHIDKIYQPSRDELVFLLRAQGLNKRLFISAHPGSARVHFTEQRPENPPTPPMFCMLLRKHLGGARISEICGSGLERIIKIKTRGLNEMGDIIHPELIIELISSSPNIILVGTDGRIIDAVHRSSIEAGGRLIQPGAIYEEPVPLGKKNILSEDIDALTSQILNCSGRLERALLATLEGFSPLICREIAYAVSGNTDINVEVLTKTGREHLKTKLLFMRRELTDGGKPVMLTDESGSPTDFSYTEIFQYGKAYTCREAESFSELLEAFYSRRAQKERIKRESQDLLRMLASLDARISKRMALRAADLKKCENREQLRVFGELLKANLYAVTPGATFIEVQNYYDENLSTVRIPLNPALSPANNAAKFFKDYKKTYTAEQTLTALIEKDKTEKEYINSVLDSLSRAETLADIAEIREELALSGYIRRAKKPQKKAADMSFKEFVSPSGYRVLVGKNNRQNDTLTLSVAAKNDTWFHTKNIPGSHVILFNSGGDISDEDVIFAARLAAENSSAAASANVPVDYTAIKFVKKPSGAKPGMVIYTTNKTVFVTPSKG